MNENKIIIPIEKDPYEEGVYVFEEYGGWICNFNNSKKK